MKTKLLLVLLFVSSVSFSQIYVNVNATGANDGTSWADAFTNLQTALTTANASTTETEMWIAAGIYKPDASNRNIRFTISKDNLKIYGGFSGTEVSVVDRNMSLLNNINETILSGDLQGNDDANITFDNTTRADNSLRIIQIDGNNLLIDGITIANGYANLTSGSGRYGAGIQLDQNVAEFTIKHSVIKNNVAYFGAGINIGSNMNYANFTFDSCIFDSNLSVRFSAFYIAPKANRITYFTLSNSLLKNNKTADDTTNNRNGQGAAAGGVHAHYVSSRMYPTIVNNTFVNNENLGSDTNSNFPVFGVSKNTNGFINSAVFANNIFWGNTNNSGTAVAIGKPFYTFVLPSVYNNIDENGFSNIPAGNQHNTSTANPAFTATNDFTLQAASPAVDAGDNTKTPISLRDVDLLNNIRIHNTTIDMGCYEYGASAYIYLARMYVDVNATGANDGSSWTDAFTDFQTALAYGLNYTSEIWIAAGTYTPHANNKTVSFNLNKENLTIYGGFDGTEVNLSDRDLTANHNTILSGDLNGNDTGVSFTAGSRADNSYHVVKINKNYITLDGLQINDGHAVEVNTTDSNGGGVLIQQNRTAVAFRNCEFNNNVANSGGAAIRAKFDAVNTSITIENCIINNNLSTFGAGILVYTKNNGNISININITNTLFSNNETKDRASYSGFSGSAIWFRSSNIGNTINATISNCTFVNNNDIGTRSGSERGPVALSVDNNDNYLNAIINNSIIYGNTVASGVAKSINFGTTYSPASIQINNSIGEDNFSNISSGNLTAISNANPLFTNTTTNDFTLQSSSPAIDAGDNNLIPAGIVADLLQNDRIFNTTVDMGCYEYGSSPVAAVNELTTNLDFTLYPNPVNNTLNIALDTAISKVVIYNLQGQKVKESTTEQVKVATLSQGIYLIKIEDKNGNTAMKKFIKK